MLEGVLVTWDRKVKQAVVRAQMRQEELWRMGLGNLGNHIFCVYDGGLFPDTP